MKTTRHFFISDDLDDLEHFEEELEREGVKTPQIHVLTLDDNGAEHHPHLHEVTDFMKKDVIHSALWGAGLGAVAAALVLLVGALTNLTASAAGWIPFIFLAIVAFGFFTWEGGLWGIQNPNVHFKYFQEQLEEGKHVFFVDLEPEQEEILERVVAAHPGAQMFGTAKGAPHWIIAWQHRLRHLFVDVLP